MTEVMNHNMFKVLLDNLYEGVYFVDIHRNILYWNKGAERICGFTRDDVIGRSCSDNILVHVDGKGKCLCHDGCPLAATIEDGQERQAHVFIMRHKDGHRVPVHVSVAPILDDDGRVVGGIEAFHDETPLMATLRQLEDLKQASFVCPVTRVANRACSERVLAQRLGEMAAENTSFAVLFIDIDHFKTVNDRYGHAVGDVALRTVARTLAGALRSYDFIGRWGGEEFVAILPGLKVAQLHLISDRMRALVEASSSKVEDRSLAITVSIGACMAQSGDTPTSVVARADELMYASKNAGRKPSDRRSCNAIGVYGG